MNPMNYAYIGRKNRARRLAFLAAFLDDAEVRDTASSSRKYEGPCAGFTFKTIEVRNFVAMQIAAILRMKDRPTEFWTGENWARLRENVRAALEKEELPDLSR